MTFRCGDIVLVPFPFTDLSALSESIMLGRIDSIRLEILTIIHMEMCKALECIGHRLMEPTVAPYRP